MRADNMQFLTDKYVRVLTIVLVVQAAMFYSASRGERIPLARPLDGFPERIGDWRLVQRGQAGCRRPADSSMCRWRASHSQCPSTATSCRGLARRASCSIGTNRAIVLWRANSRQRCGWWQIRSVITAAIRPWCASGSRWLEMMIRQPLGQACVSFRPCFPRCGSIYRPRHGSQRQAGVNCLFTLARRHDGGA